MAEDILKIENIYKSFSDGIFLSKEKKRKTALLKGVNLTIPAGKVTALTGDNGTGKSTLLNIISGFEKPDEGKILFKGAINLTTLSTYKIAKAGIGRMFQDNHIFPELSIMDNLLIADLNEFGEFPFQSIFRSRKLKISEQHKQDKASEAFETLFGSNNEFWIRRNELAGNLSYGQQRLLGLSRLLMNDYALLLLDEPSAGVHEELISQIILLVKKIMTTKKISIILIEHNQNVVAALSDYCAVLENGQISPFSTVQNLTEKN